MPELTYSEDCRTFKSVSCYICGNLTIPDDQEVMLIRKKFVCVCIACAIAIKKAKPK